MPLPKRQGPGQTERRGVGGARPTWAGILARLAVLGALSACSKTPSTIVTTVDVSGDVPPILILQTIIASASDPTHAASSARQSPLPGDAAARPAPFPFPVTLPLTVDPSFAGDATLTIEGLDWDTNAVLASGAAAVHVIAGQESTASVTLIATGVGGAGGAGGAAGAGGLGGAGGAGGLGGSAGAGL